MARRRRHARRARRVAIYRNRSQYNYFRNKIDYIVTVNAIFNASTPAYGFVEVSSDKLTVTDMLTASSTFARFGDCFALCKLKGIAMEVVPTGVNTQMGQPVSVYLSYFNNSTDNPTAEQIRENPNSTVLVPLQKSHKYISLLGDTGDWSAVSAAAFHGRFFCWSNWSGTGAVPSWSINFRLYFVYKMSLA